MNATRTSLIAVGLLFVLAADSLAQFGRAPAPIITPRPAPPVIPHVHPTTPPPQHAPQQQHVQQYRPPAPHPAFYGANSSALSLLAARGVGLLSAPQAAGQLLAYAAVVSLNANTARMPSFAPKPEPIPSLEAAASTFGLICAAPTDQGRWLAAFTTAAKTPAAIVHPNPPENGGPGAFAAVPDNGVFDRGFWLLPVVFVVGIILAVAVAIARNIQGATSGQFIRIVAVPPGEAPHEIRAAWVGLELPLARGAPVPLRLATVGVVSNRGAGAVTGYAVPGRNAVSILAANAPDAADWWRTNAPHVLAFGYQLIFPAEVCEPVNRLG